MSLAMIIVPAICLIVMGLSQAYSGAMQIVAGIKARRKEKEEEET